MPGDAFSDIYFPDAGVDAQAAVGAQRPGTTPTGVNTRACEPSTRRLRGGARSGLSKYVDARPGGLATEIQHLAVVVDHSADYLLAGDEANPTGGVPPSWVSDPSDNPTIDGVPGYPDPGDGRNPGRSFPPGGSGVVPDPHVSGPEPGSDTHGWVFVQKATQEFPYNDSDRTDQLAFGSATTKDQLLVVVYATQGDTDNISTSYLPTLSVTDSLGHTYTQAEIAVYDSPGSVPRILVVWWARNESGGACTVSVTNTSDPSAPQWAQAGYMAVLEYRGLETSTPGDGAVTGTLLIETDGSNPTGTLSTGPVPITGQTRLVLGCFAVIQTTTTVALTGPAGYTERVAIGSGVGAWPLAVYEKLSSATSETVEVAYDNTSSPFNGVGIPIVGAGWRYR